MNWNRKRPAEAIVAVIISRYRRKNCVYYKHLLLVAIHSILPFILSEEKERRERERRDIRRSVEGADRERMLLASERRVSLRKGQATHSALLTN